MTTISSRTARPTTEDVEGHGRRAAPLLPGDQHAADVEGHGKRGPFLPQPSDDIDVEAHGRRGP